MVVSTTVYSPCRSPARTRFLPDGTLDRSLFVSPKVPSVWVSYDNLWLCYLGSLGLILFLYATKWAVLRFVSVAGLAAAVFCAAVVLCVPVTWALSPDWDNEFVLPVWNYVGNPVATLTIPCVSFLIDMSRKLAGKPGDWHLRLPLELIVGVPLWMYFWAYFEFLVLGWVWI